MKKFGILFALIAVLMTGTMAWAVTTYVEADLDKYNKADGELTLVDTDEIALTKDYTFIGKLNLPTAANGVVVFSIAAGRTLTLSGDVGQGDGTATIKMDDDDVGVVTGATGTLYIAKPASTALKIKTITYTELGTVKTDRDLNVTAATGGTAGGGGTLSIGKGATATLDKSPTTTIILNVGGKGKLVLVEGASTAAGDVAFASASGLVVELPALTSLKLKDATQTIGGLTGAGEVEIVGGVANASKKLVLDGESVFNGTFKATGASAFVEIVDKAKFTIETTGGRTFTNTLFFGAGELVINGGTVAGFKAGNNSTAASITTGLGTLTVNGANTKLSIPEATTINIGTLKGNGTVAIVGNKIVGADRVDFTGSLVADDSATAGFVFKNGILTGKSDKMFGKLTVAGGGKLTVKGENALGGVGATPNGSVIVGSGTAAHLVNDGVSSKIATIDFAVTDSSYTFTTATPLSVKGAVAATATTVKLIPAIGGVAVGTPVTVFSSDADITQAVADKFVLSDALKTYWVPRLVNDGKIFQIVSLQEMPLYEVTGFKTPSIEESKDVVVELVISPDFKIAKVELVSADFKGAAADVTKPINGLTFSDTGKLVGKAVESKDITMTFRVTAVGTGAVGPAKTHTLKIGTGVVSTDVFTLTGTISTDANIEVGKTGHFATIKWVASKNGTPDNAAVVADRPVLLVPNDVISFEKMAGSSHYYSVLGKKNGTVVVKVSGDWGTVSGEATATITVTKLVDVSIDTKLTPAETTVLATAENAYKIVASNDVRDVAFAHFPASVDVAGDTARVKFTVPSDFKTLASHVSADAVFKKISATGTTLLLVKKTSPDLVVGNGDYHYADGVITIAITDNITTGYDLNPTPLRVFDPIAITKPKAGTPPNSPGGGCNTGYLPFIVLLAAPLYFLRKKD